MQGFLTVTPGETLQVNVGGQGGSVNREEGGFNGGGAGGALGYGASGDYYALAGGGGGASDIRDGAYTLADRLFVAASDASASLASRASCSSAASAAPTLSWMSVTECVPPTG